MGIQHPKPAVSDADKKASLPLMNFVSKGIQLEMLRTVLKRGAPIAEVHFLYHKP